MEQSHRDASAGSTDRMSESNGAAVDVEFVAVELEVAITGEDLSRERFIQFNKIKILERQSDVSLPACESPERGRYP